MTGMMNLLPVRVIEDKVYGCNRSTYTSLRDLADDLTSDIRQYGMVTKKGGELDAVRKDNLGEISTESEWSSTSQETEGHDNDSLNQLGKGGGKHSGGKNGGWGKGNWSSGGGKSGWGKSSGGKGTSKGSGKGKSDGCYGCGQPGHFARDAECPLNSGGGGGGKGKGKKGGGKGGGKAGGKGYRRDEIYCDNCNGL